jgi:hypothetical protein
MTRKSGSTTTQEQSKMTLQGETQTRSLLSLENCLMRTGLLFSRSLTVEEAQVWKDFLSSYPSLAIEYAFENWQRNGHYFPKPAQILELIRAYSIEHRSDYVHRYEHHGEGYSAADVILLWKIFHEKYPDPLTKSLTYEQRQDLIDELDRRKAAA